GAGADLEARRPLARDDKGSPTHHRARAPCRRAQGLSGPDEHPSRHRDGGITAMAQSRRLLLKLAGASALVLLGWHSVLGAASRAAEPLVLEARIPLGEVSGRIDHLAYDTKRGRLIVAELGNNSVSILDPDQRTIVHRIAGLNLPQGVAYL